MTRMRQRIAQRLKEAQNVNAMLTTFNEVDMRFVCRTLPACVCIVDPHILNMWML